MFIPWFDPTFLLLIPALILAFWAQITVSSRFRAFSRMESLTGFTGEKLARYLLDSAGLYDVKIETISGQLTDHYDPKSKVIRLSSATYGSSSIAALGVVSHEVGHAIQHAEKYAPLVIRNIVASAAGFGSSLAWILFIIGLLFVSPVLMKIGIVLFSIAVFFTLITLPVEFNASSRALQLLRQRIAMPEEELDGVRKVLNAAALTYVASAAMAALQLLRMIILARAYGGRD
ncbi:MAG: zinc metallopeptidase [Thermotogae bacterium]|nr:zinc metallopeptidase [Thermotogota bacterium]